MTSFTFASYFVVAGFIYFLPSFVASGRKHRNTVAIFALNFLLGWTFLGWVIALVWSLTSEKTVSQVYDETRDYTT
jgi:Superinfection immunity protein